MTPGLEPGTPAIGGVVELREDVPLKGSGGGDGGDAGCGRPRGVLACFGALSVGITLALLLQIYWGGSDGSGGAGVHGAVAAGGGSLCSRAGTDALRSGGGALDAAAVTAFCLALAAPHATSLDASGVMLVWPYRSARDKPPRLVQWGAQTEGSARGATVPGGHAGLGGRRPRLVCALAALHAGAAGSFAHLTWRDWLQPAIELANTSIPISAPIEAAALAAGKLLSPYGLLVHPPHLVAFLKQLQNYSSTEMSEWCGDWGGVSVGEAAGYNTSGWQLWSVGPPQEGTGPLDGVTALREAILEQYTIHPGMVLEKLDPLDTAIYRAAISLNSSGAWEGDAATAGGPASGLAVIDSSDTYLALVTGLSQWFGSGSTATAGAGGGGAADEEGWTRDEPAARLDLAPAILVQDEVCGIRYVLGAESSTALAQAGAALYESGVVAAAAAAVERARLGVGGGVEHRTPPAPPPSHALASLVTRAGGGPHAALPPYAAVNLVQQRGDTLASHADSRGAGLASRF